MDKAYLRKDILARRLALDPAYAEQAAQSIIPHIGALLPEGRHTIACYAPVRGEISLHPAMEYLSGKGHVLCLPFVGHKEAPLVFRQWKPGEPLIKGSYGIDTPQQDRAAVPDIVIAPLMAFDAQGNRLGYGSGYYDRTIERLRAANKALWVIGAAYAMQQVASVPAEPQDEKLDAVATEKETMRFI